MKVGEISNALGVSRDTIYAWVGHPELTTFFSPEARGENVIHRLFSESDVLALTTIFWLRNSEKVHEWGAIRDYLASGERRQEFPQNAITTDPRTIPLPQAEQSARAAATLAERDGALSRIRELESEVDRLRQELTTEREHHKSDIERLLREQNEMSRQIGRLEAQIEMLKGQE